MSPTEWPQYFFNRSNAPIEPSPLLAHDGCSFGASIRLFSHDARSHHQYSGTNVILSWPSNGLAYTLLSTPLLLESCLEPGFDHASDTEQIEPEPHRTRMFASDPTEMRYCSYLLDLPSKGDFRPRSFSLTPASWSSRRLRATPTFANICGSRSAGDSGMSAKIGRPNGGALI